LCSHGDDQRTDEALLDEASRGDDAAFAVLVRRHIRAATMLAAQYVGALDAAEDVVQDAFIVVHKGLRRFDRARAFAPWFYAIVRRLAANRRARDVRRSRLLQLWWRRSDQPEPASPAAEPALIAGLDAAKVSQALNGLPPMQRACFDLVSLRGLTIAEVATMHAISESTVRQHVFRARTALRAVLAGGHTDA
jgi:RNA polymerase sigma-70 factor, ECF subfamily